MNTPLNKTFDSALELNGNDFFFEQVPDYLQRNLKHDFISRRYQCEAFGRFVYYMSGYKGKPDGAPMQLLFHMATGSGKTLIMAGIILYLYGKGYRNFLFFVNSSNIIEKTKDNFLNKLSPKYLFKDTISISGKKIEIKETGNFQAANQDNINIVFSTIQGLHSHLNTPGEDSVTYDDFEDKKVCLISDEAHHINAETKKGKDISREEQEEIVSWESTVNRIYNSNRENLLLEFTATADISNPLIGAKYNDKLIFDYPLKQFRIDGYSKEVKVLQADAEPFDRALLAVLLSQHRRKVFQDIRKNIKPVILFKSRTIKESELFMEDFETGIKRLKPADIGRTLASGGKEPAVNAAAQYFRDKGITYENLISELQDEFKTDNLISVNSKDESEQKQIAVNTLEAENNEYRAVFAVDKLNEGWDVLNLFDIVRLYDTRDAKAGKPGKTTMSEAQLIGRGARYCPFRLNDGQPFFQRKFDKDAGNPLRICEELYYHSAYNPKYIDELHNALVEIGMKSKDMREQTLKLKDSFKDTVFYDKGYIYLNRRQGYSAKAVFEIDKGIQSKKYPRFLSTGATGTDTVFEKKTRNVAAQDITIRDFRIPDFGIPVVRKALNRLDFYKFSNLAGYFGNLSSMSEFITNKQYLGNITVEVSGTAEKISSMNVNEKLFVVQSVLNEMVGDIEKSAATYKGTVDFYPEKIKDRIKTEKVLNFAADTGGDKEAGRSMITDYPLNSEYYLDLSKKNWYVFNDCFGTSEEKMLVKYIDKTYTKLQAKYDEIYLIRNEKFFQIYSFDEGLPFEPDFVLFLLKSGKETYYQIFIEPKGVHLVDKDTEKLKKKFLLQLRTTHKLQAIFKGRECIVWGMPFYNKKTEKDFDDVMKLVLKSWESL